MPKRSWNSLTRDELIIEVWEALDCESVGAIELEQIQEELKQKFGEGGLASPAAIARIVADEGAVLRHPEVFESDLKWRRQTLEQNAIAGELDFSTFSSAFQSVVQIEERRLALQSGNDLKARKELRDLVTTAREDLRLRARSKILDQSQRQQAKEISEWLRVWLQTPELFSDWLDLRRSSPEFRARFETD